ncbi:response regulator transcription factor [Tessaracoccus coleopterorum]|uniref:response regulator transcription factor n=1 Tax=Tessaracoccus coleopterorum TaxID=2714950 RepID=UPI0038CD5A23
MPLSSTVRRQLVEAVVADGRVEPAVAMTPRETDLLRELMRGLTNRQIGRNLHLSEGSVKQYLSHIGTKLGSPPVPRSWSRRSSCASSIRTRWPTPSRQPPVGRLRPACGARPRPAPAAVVLRIGNTAVEIKVELSRLNFESTPGETIR